MAAMRVVRWIAVIAAIVIVLGVGTVVLLTALRPWSWEPVGGRDARPATPGDATAATTRAPRAATASYSNVERGDYVGPAVCGDCHPDKHEQWRGSLHAVMNQRADGVVAPFAGETVAYAGGVARFTRERGAPVMELTAAGETRRFRVTRTIGARALQEYVGTGDDGTEVRLPFGWWIARPGWYPQPYFDSWFGAEYDDGRAAFDAFRPDPTPWATRCAWCHNTYPFALRLARRAGLGNGPEAHVEPIAGDTRFASAAIHDRNLLPVEQLVTVGISCESCHLGGREHADGAPPRFTPASPALRRVDGAPPPDAGRRDPRTVNALCAQCHSTPSPRYPDGSAARNSTEALDLARGACATGISETAVCPDMLACARMLRCTDCHDPHRRGPLADAVAIAACTGCHATLADPAAARAHARHAPADATCLDCHMPRIVEGIDGFVRSHRISSPTDPAMLAAAAPNACNLCHLDRSIRWTAAELRAGWGVALAPDARWRRAYGDLDHAVGTVWLTGAAAPPRLAAAAAFAAAADRAALPSLVALLDDPVAHDRMWMLFAVERLLGRRLTAAEYDPLAAPAVRARQARALRARAAAGLR